MCDSFWEPVAEIYLVEREKTDDYYNCVVSRVVLGDTKNCTVLSSENDSEEEAIEKDFMEWTLDLDKGSRTEVQSIEKHDEEAVSCYGSASHTDNNYSTDEHDSVRDSAHRPTVHASTQKHGLHQSDSGADLSEYRDHHEARKISKSHVKIFKTADTVIESDYKKVDMLAECIECDKELIAQNLVTNTVSEVHNEDNSFTEYNYAPYIDSYSAYHGNDETEMHKAWLHFWAENGERLIWSSWIKKYVDYINPDYFQSNTAREDEKAQNVEEVNEPAAEKCRETCGPNEACRSCEHVPSTSNRIFRKDDLSDERTLEELPQDETIGEGWNPLSQQSIEENYQYSNAEDERLLTRCDSINGSVTRTNVASDSMTNVTKMTLTSSSYDSSSSFSSSCSSSSLSLNLDIFFESSAQESDVTSTSDPEDNFREYDKDWQHLWWEHFESQYRQQYELFVLNYTKARSVDHALTDEDIEYDTEADLSDDAVEEINKSSPNKVRSTKSGKTSRNTRASASYKRKAENLILSSVGALLKNLATDPNVSAMPSPYVEEDQQDTPHRFSTHYSSMKRRTHRQKRGSAGSQAPNKSLIGLRFKSERSIKRNGDITFRKRNIIWKAIKSVKEPKNEQLSEPPCSSDTDAILQNKALRHTLQHRASEPAIYNNIHADERFNNLLETDTDSDPGFKIKNKKYTYAFSSSSEALDNQIESDDNEEIIAHQLTELDVPESDEDNEEKVWERRRCKRLRIGEDIEDPPEEIKREELVRYWLNRYELFHKYDDGIQLDKESWYSVTPERIARQIAQRCKCDVIIDAFCGAGGNAIQFAFMCSKVIAIDIDPKKIELAKNNAKLYGVDEKIEFIVGNFLELAPNLKADVVFLSPPWGGPGYQEPSVFDIKLILFDNGGKEIYKAARRISTSVAYYLPRNVNIEQVRRLAKKRSIETEQYFEDNRAIAVTCYYGGLVTTENIENAKEI